MKNQLNKQAKTFLDSATRETQDAAREIQTSSTHSAKVRKLFLYKRKLFYNVVESSKDNTNNKFTLNFIDH